MSVVGGSTAADDDKDKDGDVVGFGDGPVDRSEKFRFAKTGLVGDAKINGWPTVSENKPLPHAKE